VALTKKFLEAWQTESNAIEGLHRSRARLREEVDALATFLANKRVASFEILLLANALEPNAVLRTRVGQNVRVAGHVAPPGGPSIRRDFAELLVTVSENDVNPVIGHAAYLQLHPLTDCNGRTSRALYLWHTTTLLGRTPDMFLEDYYRTSLALWDKVSGADWRTIINGEKKTK